MRKEKRRTTTLIGFFAAANVVVFTEMERQEVTGYDDFTPQNLVPLVATATGPVVADLSIVQMTHASGSSGHGPIYDRLGAVPAINRRLNLEGAYFGLIHPDQENEDQ